MLHVSNLGRAIGEEPEIPRRLEKKGKTETGILLYFLRLEEEGMTNTYFLYKVAKPIL